MNQNELRRRLIVATTQSLVEMGYAMSYRFVLFQPGVEITVTRPDNPKFVPLVWKGDTPSQIMRDLALEVLMYDQSPTV